MDKFDSMDVIETGAIQDTYAPGDFSHKPWEAWTPEEDEIRFQRFLKEQREQTGHAELSALHEATAVSKQCAWQKYGAKTIGEVNSDENVCEVMEFMPGMIKEGITLVAARDKVGKTFWAMDLAEAIASVVSFLGRTPETPHKCIYFDYENGDAVFKARFKSMEIHDPYNNFIIVDGEANNLSVANGKLAEAIEQFAKEDKDAKVFIIDTWRSARGNVKNKGMANAAEADTELMKPLLAIAKKYHIAIVILHHLRKNNLGSTEDLVSGSNGLSATVTAKIILIQTGKGDTSSIFKVLIKGRSLESREETWQRLNNGRWILSGDSEHASNPIVKFILANVPEHGLAPKFIQYTELPPVVDNTMTVHEASDACKALVEQTYSHYGIFVQTDAKSNGKKGIRISQ